MPRRPACREFVIALTCASLALFQGSAFADDTRPADLQGEVDSLKAENAAVRELLRQMVEQQKEKWNEETKTRSP